MSGISNEDTPMSHEMLSVIPNSQFPVISKTFSLSMQYEMSKGLRISLLSTEEYRSFSNNSKTICNTGVKSITRPLCVSENKIISHYSKQCNF